MIARRAWLTLGDLVLPLDDAEAGYLCTELDIGYPEVREVVTNRPDADGTDDRSRLHGSRTVSANLTAWGEGRTIDDVVRSFGPFVVASARPELHFTVDSPEDNYAERMIRLAPRAFSAPMTHPPSRSISLGWVAPDPVIWDPVEQSTTSRPFVSGARFGRHYPLIFDRVYPTGAGSGGNGNIQSPGITVRPRIRIYGPITAPRIVINTFPPGEARIDSALYFAVSFRVDATRYVEIDSALRSIRRDDGTNVLDQVQWDQSTWPIGLGNNVMNLFLIAGTSVDWNTQAIAYWHDGYMT